MPRLTTPARSISRRAFMIGVCLLAVAGGMTAWLLARPGHEAPTLTWNGSRIAAPSRVLDVAEQTVTELVVVRHGAQNQDTRCYFQEPSHPSPGAAESDVLPTLLCGPVLFVDGNVARAYVSVPLTAAGSGHGTQALSTPRSLDSVTPQALNGRLRLVRPDHKIPPKHAGGLHVPRPMAAGPDALQVAELSPSTIVPAIKHVELIGKTTGLVLTAAGSVPRFGTGDSARVASPGYELIAFRIVQRCGDLDCTGVVKPTIVVNGGAPRTVPATRGATQYVVASVPRGALASLRFTDGGVTQTLSIPDGRPGAGNVAVLARSHRTDSRRVRVNVPIRVSLGGRAANFTLHATLATASLEYWLPGHEGTFPQSARAAYLVPSLTYVDSSAPGHAYAFDPQLLTLRLSHGPAVRARNLAGASAVFDVFLVPANFSTGTLEISGSEKVGGETVAVRHPTRIPISIPTG